jgi:glucokinase
MARTTSPGERSLLIWLNKNMASIVFDIGGTHMRSARVNGSVPSDIQRTDTPLSPEEGFSALVSLIRAAAQGEASDALYGGVAGVVDAAGVLLASPNLPLWGGFPLAKRLAEYFGVPAVVRNDAALAGLGEACYGAGREGHIVAHLRVGTGVGGACIVEKRIQPSAQGFEPGHQVIDVTTCATLESFAGGAALGAQYGAHPLPREVYARATRALAVGVWNAIVHWSPDVVVLGGSMMNEDNGYRLAEVQSEVEKLRVALPTLPDIRIGTLYDEAGLYGALALGREKKNLTNSF